MADNLMFKKQWYQGFFFFFFYFLSFFLSFIRSCMHPPLFEPIEGGEYNRGMN